MSGIHARIQKKEGNLLVTDLDSTNGTYIDDKRLKPGVAANVPSGSLLTFGILIFLSHVHPIPTSRNRVFVFF